MRVPPLHPELFPPGLALRSYADLHKSLDVQGRLVLEAIAQDLERRGLSRADAELRAAMRWTAELRARALRTMQSPR